MKGRPAGKPAERIAWRLGRGWPIKQTNLELGKC